MLKPQGFSKLQIQILLTEITLPLFQNLDNFGVGNLNRSGNEFLTTNPTHAPLSEKRKNTP